jgi:hypothetical protein
MEIPDYNQLILAELRRMNHLLTLSFIESKSDHDKIAFLSDLQMSSTEIAKYVNMHPGNIRKIAQKWRESKGK